MLDSKGDINVGAKENISRTIIWLQLGAYAGFGSAALGVIGIVRDPSIPSILAIAIGVFFAFLLLQQSQKLKEYIDTNNIKAYEDSLTHENNYWLTMMVLIIIGIALAVLSFLFVYAFLGSRL